VRLQRRHRRPPEHVTLALVAVDVAAVGAAVVALMATSAPDLAPPAPPHPPTAPNPPPTAPHAGPALRPGPFPPASSVIPGGARPSKHVEPAGTHAITHQRWVGFPRPAPATIRRTSGPSPHPTPASRWHGGTPPATPTAPDAATALPAPAAHDVSGSVGKPRPEAARAQPALAVTTPATAADTNRTPPPTAVEARSIYVTPNHTQRLGDPNTTGVRWSMPLTWQDTEHENDDCPDPRRTMLSRRW
jgi:hypothetical protein